MTNRTRNGCLAIGAFITVMLFVPGAMTLTSAGGAAPGGMAGPTAGQQGYLTTSLTAGPASQVVFTGDPAVAIAFKNNLNSTVLSTVYAVVHNPSGQVVLLTASNLVAAPNTTQTVYLDVAGLSTGSYRVGVFAESNAVVISSETVLAVTIP